MKDRLPKVSKPESIYSVYYLFASICYHYNYLEGFLHQVCPFRSSPFFVDVPCYMKQQIRIAYPWTKTSDTPKFTGLPPYVKLMAQLKFMNEKMEEMKELINGLDDSLGGKIQSEFDERGVGCSEFYTRKLEEKLNTMENQNTMILNEVRKNIRQDHECKNITRNDAIDGLYDFIDEDVQICEFKDKNQNENIGKGINSANCRLDDNKRKNDHIQAIVKKRKITIGLVKGKLTILPPDFKFPQMTCEQLIRNWFLGDKSKKIVPYSRLLPAHLYHVKNGRRLRQKMSRFMSVVETYGRMENCWIEGTDWDQEKVTNLWSSIGHKHIFTKYSNVRDSRVEGGAWITILNKTTKFGAFKKERKDCSSEAEWNRSIYRYQQ